MNNAYTVANRTDASDLPVVRKITFADLRDALAQGMDDFMAKPTHIIVIGVLYPLIGLVLARLAFGYDVLPLVFPLIAGFTLLGPLAAIGFYELSRRRELGLEMSWSAVSGIFRSRSRRAIITLGLVLLALFVAWLWTAQLIYTQIFGDVPPQSLAGFADQIFETPEGIRLMIIGNAVGFVFAAVIFSISVVSFPLMLDRDVSAVVAAVTSLKAVAANPLPMAAWGFIVAATLVIAATPFFLGWAVAVPLLGHATWRLYRRTIEH